jgi:hypothetical protein
MVSMILARNLDIGKQNAKPNILIIGGSNTNWTANDFAEWGYAVFRICTPGWKLTSQSVQVLLPIASEALKNLAEDDIILIQGLDNAAYYSQTEDGGEGACAPLQRQQVSRGGRPRAGLKGEVTEAFHSYRAAAATIGQAPSHLGHPYAKVAV